MELKDRIDGAKRATVGAKDKLLKSFAAVPDDKLGWAPSETARSAVWMVAHCGAANRAFAGILSGKPLPMPTDPQEAARAIRNAGRDVTTREEAVRLVEASTDDVLAALDAVTEEKLASSPDSPFGPLPYGFWMAVPGQHMAGHTQQLEYLQTIWGDLEDHAL